MVKNVKKKDFLEFPKNGCVITVHSALELFAVDFQIINAFAITPLDGA